VSMQEDPYVETEAYHMSFLVKWGMGARVWVEATKVRSTIGGEPRVVVGSEWKRRHDPSKGRIGRRRNGHTSEYRRV
jgi:hypothetical protein